jgi:hypothetical protein
VDLTIAERLVCPRTTHPVTPLVVRADRTEHGHLIEGLAGCPVCQDEWPVHGGVLTMGPRTRHAVEPTPDGDSLAALLTLTDPGAIVIADGLTDETVDVLGSRYGAQLIVMDGASRGAVAAPIDGAMRAPIAAGVARGAALFRSTRSAEFIESVVDALEGSGRIVAATGIAASPRISVLVRDDTMWVGERVAAPVPITPRRRPSQ